MSDTRGIIYLFCGAGAAERIIVSLHSLRKHYDGPVTVLVTDDDCRDIIQAAQADIPHIDMQRMDKAAYRRNAAYATKSLVPSHSPYDRTLFIDADTLIVGDPTPLFDYLDTRELVVTNFGNWQSQGNKMKKRIGGWKGLTPAIDAMVADQLSKQWPAINTGVFAFRKDWQYARQWHTITDKGSPKHMADELAMQLLLSVMDPKTYEVVDDRWNTSPLYGAMQQDAVIWHFHGRKHVRKEACKKLWVPAFEECREKNVGGIAEWAGKWDKTVRAYLTGNTP